MDYRLYHAINEFVADHDWIGQAFNDFETWAVPLFAVATFALWYRPPRRRPKWKSPRPRRWHQRRSALLINQVIGKIWHRERPFAAHLPLTSGAAARTTLRSPATTRAPRSRSPSLSFSRSACWLALPRGGCPPRSGSSCGRRALSRRRCRRLLGWLGAALCRSSRRNASHREARAYGGESDRSSRRPTVGPAEQGSGHAMKAAVQKVAFDNGGEFIRETRREVEQYLARGSHASRARCSSMRRRRSRSGSPPLRGRCSCSRGPV